MENDTGVANPPLDGRFVVAINNLRELAKEYHLKDEIEQKNIRHHIYKMCGGFGKELVPFLPKFKEIEDKLIHQNKA